MCSLSKGVEESQGVFEPHLISEARGRGIYKMKGKFTWILLFGMVVLVVGCGRDDKESDELLDAFLAGEIPAFYGDAGESSINFDQLPVDEEDWISYSVGERIDLDNDGENELILNGPYGGMYIDARGGKTYVLAPPFFVVATQNPIETAGAFPLPEAQMDRFLMQISMGFPRQSFIF